MLGLMSYYKIARPNIMDRTKVAKIILSVSGFIPALWTRMVIGQIKKVLRKITPLRRLYKKIKYGDSHHGEH